MQVLEGWIQELDDSGGIVEITRTKNSRGERHYMAIFDESFYELGSGHLYHPSLHWISIICWAFDVNDSIGESCLAARRQGVTGGTNELHWRHGLY